jgi:hypothetical protein
VVLAILYYQLEGMYYPCTSIIKLQVLQLRNPIFSLIISLRPSVLNFWLLVVICLWSLAIVTSGNSGRYAIKGWSLAIKIANSEMAI